MIVTFIVAIVWSASGIMKLVAPSELESWFLSFPQWVRYAVILGETAAGAALFAGFRRLGLVVGLVLLLVFAGALFASPPAPGQSCGCLGALPVMSGAREVAAHLFAFASLHVFGAALVFGAHTSGKSAPAPELA